MSSRSIAFALNNQVPSNIGTLVWPPLQYLKPLDVVVIRKDGSITIVPDASHMVSRQTMRQIHIANEAEENSHHIALTSGLTNLFLQALNVTPSGISSDLPAANLKWKNLETQYLISVVSANMDSNNRHKAVQTLSMALDGMQLDMTNRNFEDAVRVYVITTVTSASDVILKLSHSYGQSKSINAAEFIKGHDDSLVATTNFRQKNLPVTIAIRALQFHVVNNHLDGGTMSDVLYGDGFSKGLDQMHSEELLWDFCTTCQASFMSSNPITIAPLRPLIKQALLIGNNNYQNAPPLQGCHNDVNEFGNFLSKQGFSINKRFDQSFLDILNCLASFSAENLVITQQTQIECDEVLLLYFSGYGSRRRKSDFVDTKTGEAEYEDVFVPIDGPNRDDLICGGKENIDISASFIADWVNLIRKSRQTLGCSINVLVINDSGGSYDSFKCAVNSDENLRSLKKSRALPPDTRIPSKQNRPKVVGSFKNVSSQENQCNIGEGFMILQASNVHETCMEMEKNLGLGNIRWEGAMTHFLLTTLQHDPFRNIRPEFFKVVLDYLTSRNLVLEGNQGEQQHLQIHGDLSDLVPIMQSLLYSSSESPNGKPRNLKDINLNTQHRLGICRRQ